MITYGISLTVYFIWQVIIAMSPSELQLLHLPPPWQLPTSLQIEAFFALLFFIIMAKDPVSTRTPISTTENSTPEKEFKPRPSTRTDPIRQKNDNKNSDSEESATNSSDESDEEPTTPEPTFSAIRGRWLWQAFLKLAKPVRVLLVSLLGSAFFIAPFLVVNLRFRSHPAKIQVQVHVWSLWLTTTWAAGCATYMVVDLIPRLVVYVTRLFGGKIERLKIQVEVRYFTWPKRLCLIARAVDDGSKIVVKTCP